MVHALQKAASLLNSGGVLIEVHDILDPPRIEVHAGGRTNYIGQLLSRNDFENQCFAEQALLQVIQDDFLMSVQSRLFEYLFYADSFADLNHWLEDSWEDAYMLDEAKHLIDKLTKQDGKSAKIVLRMISRIMMTPASSFPPIFLEY